MDTKREQLVVLFTLMAFGELTAAMGLCKFGRMFPSKGKLNGTTCGNVAKVRDHMSDIMTSASPTTIKDNKDSSEKTRKHIPTEETAPSDKSTTNLGEKMTFIYTSGSDNFGAASKPASHKSQVQITKVSDATTTSSDSTTVTTTCPSDGIYPTCSCQGTCQDPDGCQNICISETPMTCCADGLLMKENSCVPMEECGCYVEEWNTVLSEGESIGCPAAQKCANGKLNDFACNDPDAECTQIDNSQQCVCKRGLYGHGQQCTKSCKGLYFIGYIKRCTDERNCGEGDKTCYCPSFSNDDCNVAPDCKEIYEAGHTKSGVYYIKPSEWQKAPFKVYCDMTEDGGWTVIQNRTGPNLWKFRRSWMSYKKGYNNSHSSFWLGNDKIHFLTVKYNYELRIDVKQKQNDVIQHTCKDFRIKSEGEKYELEVTGDCELSDNKGAPFSTYDSDNSNGCGRERQGGWWYKSSPDCGNTDLNGKEILWPNVNDFEYTVMKIRPNH